MNCFERTSWFLCFALSVGLSCMAAPTSTDHPSNRSLSELSRPSKFGDEASFNHSVHIPFETTTQRVGPLNLEIPLHRRPPVINTGPGKYLEDRRRQTESRIQELQKQVNFLLEAHRREGDHVPGHDPERDAQTAIQYGLNCQRGETLIVCLMKKVIILRREVSGIQRDVSVLGKEYRRLLVQFTRGTIGQDETQIEYGSGDSDGPTSDFDTVTHSTNETAKDDGDSLNPQADPLCPDKFERVGSICYYVVTDRANGVSSARNFCLTRGGFLARPKDSLALNDLANHLIRLHDKGSNQLSELWVEGQYDTEEETWKWNNDQRIDSSIWGISDTPTTAHRQGTCVLLKKELNYFAMPQDCGYHYFFVCEAEMIDGGSSV